MFLKSLHTLILAIHAHPAINLIGIHSNPHTREHQDVCTPVVWWASCTMWDKVHQLLSPYPVSVVLLNKKCQASLWADLSYPAGVTSYYGKVLCFIILLPSDSLNLRLGCCPLSAFACLRYTDYVSSLLFGWANRKSNGMADKLQPLALECPSAFLLLTSYLCCGLMGAQACWFSQKQHIPQFYCREWWLL